MTFEELLEGLQKACLAERQMARDAERKAEMYEAEIRGMERARSALLVARGEFIPAEKPFVAAETSGDEDQQQRRQRRDVRGMVLVALREAPLGISVESLVEKLGITKAQAESALGYHADKDEARRSDSGIWFAAGSPPVSKPMPSWVREDDGKGGVDLNHNSGFQPGLPGA